MAKPITRSRQINAIRADLAGVDDPDKAIREDRCQPPPIGCGGPATAFRDALSAKEFRITGMCQKCQDEFFNTEEE